MKYFCVQDCSSDSVATVLAYCTCGQATFAQATVHLWLPTRHCTTPTVPSPKPSLGWASFTAGETKGQPDQRSARPKRPRVRPKICQMGVPPDQRSVRKKIRWNCSQKFYVRAGFKCKRSGEWNMKMRTIRACIQMYQTLRPNCVSVLWTLILFWSLRPLV